MPAGQTFRLKRHQWQQFTPTDPSGLESTDQDVTLVPWQQTTASYLRYRGRPQDGQWPVQPRDVNPLQSTDQDTSIVPEWPGQGYLQRYRGRPQQQQFTPTDPSGLELADQDVTLRPVPVTTPYALRKGRPWWQQFTPTDPSGLELADQDVNLLPWTPDTPDYQRYRGRPQWAQYRPVDISNYPGNLPDQDLTFWPVLRRVWYPTPRAPHQQYTPTDPSSLELADQDVRLVPTRWPTVYALRHGKQQWYQFTPFVFVAIIPSPPYHITVSRDFATTISIDFNYTVTKDSAITEDDP